MAEREGECEFNWCKAHATANQLAFGIVSTQDLLGNCYADAFAANGAVLHQISDSDKSSFDICVGRMINVQKRLVAVLQLCQEFTAAQQKKLREEAKTPLFRFLLLIFSVYTMPDTVKHHATIQVKRGSAKLAARLNRRHVVKSLCLQSSLALVIEERHLVQRIMPLQCSRRCEAKPFLP